MIEIGGTKINPVGGSGEPERDGACTPEWLTDLIGHVDVDPCSNPRSTVRSAVRHCGGPDDDGLLAAPTYDSGTRTFVNPPYSRGQVLAWVEAYRHTDFIFLLRWDPSTAWFRALMPHVTNVWFASQRLEFVPPPGVTFSKNPYPHALYFANPAPARFREHGVVLRC